MGRTAASAATSIRSAVVSLPPRRRRCGRGADGSWTGTGLACRAGRGGPAPVAGRGPVASRTAASGGHGRVVLRPICRVTDVSANNSYREDLSFTALHDRRHAETQTVTTTGQRLHRRHISVIANIRPVNTFVTPGRRATAADRPASDDTPIERAGQRHIIGSPAARGPPPPCDPGIDNPAVSVNTLRNAPETRAAARSSPPHWQYRDPVITPGITEISERKMLALTHLRSAGTSV